MSFHVLLLDTVGNNLVNADFSPYLGHIFAVKHIYLTLYIAYAYRIAPIYSAHLAPARRSRRTSGPIASSRSLSVRPRGRARRARARPRALPCPCACACGRVRARVCVGAVRLPSSRLPCISFAYIVASPAVLLLAVPAANFFEIVFKPSISIPPSPAWVRDTVLYCYTGCFVGIVML